ncbi:hypothetical protein ACJ41O_014756 [Fusarium nematophilum]
MGDSTVVGSLGSQDAKVGTTTPTADPVAEPKNDSNVSGSAPVANNQDLFPGLRNVQGRHTYGVEETLEVIELLRAADIPACVVDVNALRYYRAGRVTWEWDICLPTHRLADAEQIFKQNDLYEPAKPPPPLFKSFRHINPIFQRKGVGYLFILTPSSQWFMDPAPENCELSKNGIPYPKMPQFARSLLVLQYGSNIADFIDGMNLDEKWGEENIDFDDLQVKGIEFTKAKNAELEALDMGPLNKFKINVDYKRCWNEIVAEKERRIEPMKKGRYKTRWRRIRNDVDPREKKDRPF